MGVDLGIKDFAVTSGGQRIANRGTWNAGAEPGSLTAAHGPLPARVREPRKARAKVAGAHRKVRAARTDFLHKASTA